MRPAALLLFLACGCRLAAATDVAPATGATIDESRDQIFIKVDPYYIPKEEDEPQDIPPATIQEGIRRAIGYLQREIPVRIFILNGLYREAVTVPGGGHNALLVIEGQSRDGAVISGSEPITEGWEHIEDAAFSTWALRWRKDWGDFTRDQVQSASAREESPQRLISKGRPASIALRWEPPVKPKAEIAGYRVYRQKAGIDPTFHRVADMLQTTRWEDTTVVPATAFEDHNYSYYVTTVDKWDNESPPSGIINSRARDPQSAGYQPTTVRRRETVFADGQPLRMIRSQAELAPGTFLINDGYLRNPDDGFLVVCLAEGKSPADTKIEAATNLNLGRKTASACLYVVDKPNLYIRNLTLKHSVEDGLRLDSCRNVKLENITAIDNRGSGIEVNVMRNLQPYTENITLSNIDASGNGAAGISGSRFQNLLIENCTTNRNNWRGAEADFYGWDRAGIKLFNVHRGTLRNITALSNQTYGVWINYNCRDITVDNAVVRDNRRYGLFLEASQGPVSVRNSLLAENEIGLYLANVRDGTLADCIIANNRRAQIALHDRIDREVVDWQVGTEDLVNTEGWSWRNNIIASTTGTDAPLVLAPYNDWRFFYDSLESSGNLWWTADELSAYELEGQRTDLRDWQFASGQDTQSLFAEPKLVEASGSRLVAGTDSPVHDRANWPVTELPGNRLDMMKAKIEEDKAEQEKRYEERPED